MAAAAATRVLHGNRNNCFGNTAVMGTVVAVIPWERLLLKQCYHGSGNRIL